MFAVIDCRTQNLLKKSASYETLLSEFEEKGLLLYSDFYIADMYVIIDRRTQQLLASALSQKEVLEQVNYQINDDYFIGKSSEFNRFTVVFLNNERNEYIAIPDGELTTNKYFNLIANGFELFSDVVTMDVSRYLQLHDVTARAAKAEVLQITLKEAQTFINTFHRHHKQPQGHRFSLGLFVANQLVGVIVAGRPVARLNDNGSTLEITRCCVLEGFKNGITILCGRVYQTAKLWGYKQVITYTLESENGVSMKAAGFRCIGKTKGGSWNSPNRKRNDKHPIIPKYKWVKDIA
jgi:hypothetical protein